MAEPVAEARNRHGNLLLCTGKGKPKSHGETASDTTGNIEAEKCLH